MSILPGLSDPFSYMGTKTPESKTGCEVNFSQTQTEPCQLDTFSRSPRPIKNYVKLSYMNYPDPTSNEKQACKQWCLLLMVVIIRFIKFISRLCKGNYTTAIPPFCSTYFGSIEKPQCPQISTEEMKHF